MNSFVEKYKPQNLEGIIGQKASISNIVTFVNDFPKKKKAIMIEGQSGAGKSLSVEVISNEMDFEVIEITPNQAENSEEMEQFFKNAVKTGSIFGKKRIVVVDFLESFSSRALTSIIKLIKETNIPIVIIVLDSWEQKFRTLRYYCDVVKFRKLSEMQISKKLISVLNSENIKFEKEVIDFISKNADGDMRAALNDLEIISVGKNEIKKQDILFLEARRIEEDIFKGLQKIFKSDFSKDLLNVFDSANLDLNMGILWILENVAKEYKNPVDLKRAYNFLSRGDVFLGRIQKRQHWRFYFYANILSTAGVNVSKSRDYSGFVRYSFPSKISKLSKTKKLRKSKKEIAEKIAEKWHVSSSVFINEYIPLLNTLIKSDPLFKKKIAEKFNLSKGEIEILSE